ncbi:hypothetical protein [Nitratireductor indicus]|nr:hypothetical protein [Nitratireductor indicus]MDS1135633.1 hypothetical protein [Nitratireductor indicus]SFQ11423.1 hypothetical protein SAMN05216176_101407 [Nitratireductor indicus]
MRKPLMIGAILALVPSFAYSASGIVPFRGEVMSTCAITVDRAGTLAISPDYTILSSTQSGGMAGQVSILASGVGYSVSTSAPASFSSAPPTGNSHVTFASIYSASGATTALNVPGTTMTPLVSGLTDLSVDLTATKSSGVFQSGTYAADVIVTCE